MGSLNEDAQALLEQAHLAAHPLRSPPPPLPPAAALSHAHLLWPPRAHSLLPPFPPRPSPGAKPNLPPPFSLSPFLGHSGISGEIPDTPLLFIFAGPHLWHKEVPRLGVKSELQLLAYTTATAMQDPSHVCKLHHSLGNAGSPTHCVRPGIKPPSSWIQFFSAAPQWELCLLCPINMINLFPG